MNDVVIVTFSELSDARAASSELERLASEARIALHAQALVVRDADGRFRIPDGGQTEALDVSYENALGELLGTLVGPVGLLSRLASPEATERVLGSLARRVPPGTTALVADIDAQNPRVLDAAIEASGGSVTRRLQADIEGELAATLEVMNADARMRPSPVAHATDMRR